MACSKDFFEHAQRAGRSRGALEARGLAAGGDAHEWSVRCAN